MVKNRVDPNRIVWAIEEAFRDLKSLSGFKHLALKDTEQPRVEQILMLVIIDMGLLFLLFAKSGYRWSKYYNTSCRKEYSLIHVIAGRIRVSWANLVTTPCDRKIRIFRLTKSQFGGRLSSNLVICQVSKSDERE